MNRRKLFKRERYIKFRAVYRCSLMIIMFIFTLSACGTKKDNDDSTLDIYSVEHDPLGIINNNDKIHTDSDDISDSSDVIHTDDIIDDTITASSTTDPSIDDDNEHNSDSEVEQSLDSEKIGSDSENDGDIDTNINTSSGNDNTNTDNHSSSSIFNFNRDEIAEGIYKDLDNTNYGWSIKRSDNNEPTGTYESFDINEYNAFYLNKDVYDEDKVIYLTFDCGYENGFTPSLLDTLKKHNAKAMFFITKYFLTENIDLVKRMKEEGHLVGNHTMNHPSLPTISLEKLKEEVYGLEDLMKEHTGYDLNLFIRPPKGEYSKRTLKILEDMGYTTIFWSIVYVDYDIADQPGKDFVVKHFKSYHHNGAIPLMHNVSESNAEALDDVLTYLELQGYRFGTLDELLK